MKEKIRKNEIGKIVSCYARRRGNRHGIEKYASWTDLLSSTLIHDIQMVLEINKSKPIRVFAEAVVRECKKFNSHDAVMALIKFNDGSIASFETSWVLPKNQPEPLDPSLHVVGDKGSIIIESSSQGMQIQTENEYLKPDLTHWPVIDGKVDGSLKKNLDKFISDCIEKNIPDVNILKAYIAEKVIFAMKESIKKNKPIKIVWIDINNEININNLANIRYENLIFYINLSFSTFLNIRKPIINKIKSDDIPNFGEEKI